MDEQNASLVHNDAGDEEEYNPYPSSNASNNYTDVYQNNFVSILSCNHFWWWNMLRHKRCEP